MAGAGRATGVAPNNVMLVHPRHKHMYTSGHMPAPGTRHLSNRSLLHWPTRSLIELLTGEHKAHTLTTQLVL